MELQVLATVLQRPIEVSSPHFTGHPLNEICVLQVVQAEGPPMVLGEQFAQKPLILTYHRHAYGLGEHYNSVTSKNSS